MTFQIIDLVSQALAIEEQFAGKSDMAILEWLQHKGTLYELQALYLTLINYLYFVLIWALKLHFLSIMVNFFLSAIMALFVRLRFLSRHLFLLTHPW